MRVGPYTYEIKRNGKQSFYSVTDGKDTISLPIHYAFGEGKMGQTYVLQRDGKFYESLVSFYNETKGLDYDRRAATRAGVTQRCGWPLLTPNEVSNCFACHATGAVIGSQLRLEKFAHGVRCESCHGPGGGHVAAIKEGSRAGRRFSIRAIEWRPVDAAVLRLVSSWRDEFSLLKSMEINNVRFQPYRIFNSKCYSDEREISCIACHDPHEPLREDAAYYDKKCLACHSLKTKTAAAKTGDGTSCPVADKNCTRVTCPRSRSRPRTLNSRIITFAS